MKQGPVREPEIALVLSADRWVDELHRHCTDHGGARVRFMVLDPIVALDEEFDVLVTSDRWPALTRPFVDALHSRGRQVLLVGEQPGAADLAARLGVDGTVGADRSPPEVVAAVVALVPGGAPSDPDHSGASARSIDRIDPADSVHPIDPADSAHPVGSVGAAGPVIAVGGPFGGGSTEVAIGLAASRARRGDRPVLVDADAVTPSVAARLGLPLEPNLCTAVDAVAYGLGAVPGALFDLGDDWPAVLVGAPNRRSGATLRSADVVAVAEVLAARFSPVLVDVSAGIRALPEDGDVTMAVVGRAASVVAVGAANPVGVIRLIDWIREVTGTTGTVAVHVVVNRAPGSRSRRAEIAGEIQRELRVAGCTFVPADPRVEDASWAATVVERGAFARAIDGLGRTVIAGARGVGAVPA